METIPGAQTAPPAAHRAARNASFYARSVLGTASGNACVYFVRARFSVSSKAAGLRHLDGSKAMGIPASRLTLRGCSEHFCVHKRDFFSPLSLSFSGDWRMLNLLKKEDFYTFDLQNTAKL